MSSEHSSTGDTQVISTDERHGFVDNCIALIENLLDARSIPAAPPDPTGE